MNFFYLHRIEFQFISLLVARIFISTEPSNNNYSITIVFSCYGKRCIIYKHFVQMKRKKNKAILQRQIEEIVITKVTPMDDFRSFTELPPVTGRA